MPDSNMPEKTTVLIIVPSLACGGLERNVSILCNNINSNTFQVTLAVIDHSAPFYTISNPAVSVVDLQCTRVRQSIWKIRSLVKQTRPDILLCAANHLNLLLSICRPLFPKRMPIIARESSVVSVNSKRAAWPILYNFLLKAFYKKLDMIVCQSAFMQDDLITHYQVPRNKTRIIYNALSVPESPAQQVTEPGVRRFLTVARLSEEKGIERLIRSVALLGMPFHYTIVGDGPERSKLEKLIRELKLDNRVTLTGSLNEPFTAMAQPDLFLMGSHYEGFPNVVMEAQSLGIPVIAFDVPGGMKDVIRHGQNGLLVETDTPEAFADMINRGLQYAFDRTLIQSDTRKRFDALRNAADWENLFLDMRPKRR